MGIRMVRWCEVSGTGLAAAWKPCHKEPRPIEARLGQASPSRPEGLFDILTRNPFGGPYMAESSGAIETSMQEDRVFAPPPEFARHAHIKSREEYERLYHESIDEPEQFWGR